MDGKDKILLISWLYENIYDTEGKLQEYMENILILHILTISFSEYPFHPIYYIELLLCMGNSNNKSSQCQKCYNYLTLCGIG